MEQKKSPLGWLATFRDSATERRFLKAHRNHERPEALASVALLCTFSAALSVVLAASLGASTTVVQFEPLFALAVLLPCAVVACFPRLRVIASWLLVVAAFATIALSTDAIARTGGAGLALLPSVGWICLGPHLQRVSFLQHSVLATASVLFALLDVPISGALNSPLLLALSVVAVLFFFTASEVTVFSREHSKRISWIKGRASAYQDDEDDGETQGSPMERVVCAMQDIRIILENEEHIPEHLQPVFDRVREKARFCAEFLAKHQDLFTVDIDEQLNEGALDVDEETAKWLQSELSHQRRAGSADVQQGRMASILGEVAAVPVETSPTLESMADADPRLRAVTNNGAAYWQLDLFAIEELVGKDKILLLAAKHLLTCLDDRKLLRLVHADRFWRFVAKIASLYTAPPFHNQTHAADVLFTLNSLLHTLPLPTLAAFTDVELLAAFVAAIVHDVAHPGQTNGFQCATVSPFALRYNDKSVLENYSCSLGFKVLRRSEMNWTTAMSIRDQRKLRQLVIELVLATDMSFHLDILTKFNARAPTLSTAAPDDRLLLLQILLKSADISNITKAEPVYRGWMARIVEEFYRQGDRERELGLSISPFMDRNTPQLAKSQQGMINFIGRPLYDSVVAFIGPSAAFITEHLAHNASLWGPPPSSQQTQQEAAGKKSSQPKPKAKHATPHYALPLRRQQQQQQQQQQKRRTKRGKP